MGKKPTHRPDERTRGKVEALAAYGMQQRFIAYELGISVETLTKYYADELANAKARLDAKVMQQLARFALGDPGNPKKGIAPTPAVPKVTMFWTERRCGLRKEMKHEHSGKLTVADIIGMVDDAEAE